MTVVGVTLWILPRGAKFTTTLTRKTGIVLANPDPDVAQAVIVSLEGSGDRSIHRLTKVEVEA